MTTHADRIEAANAALAELGWRCDPYGHEDGPPDVGECSECDRMRAEAVAAVLAALTPEPVAGGLTLPAIETVETALGVQGHVGVLEPIIEGVQYDTRITPILTLRRTVTWAKSIASEWEVVE